MAYTSEEIFAMNLQQLLKTAKELDIKKPQDFKKPDLIYKIFEAIAEQEGLAYTTGCLDITDDGYGFLRYPENNYIPGRDDVYVSLNQIKRFGLKRGHMVTGPVRSPKEGEKYFAMLRVDAVNYMDPSKIQEITPFEELTPYYPTEKLDLEVPEVKLAEAKVNVDKISTRIVNLFSPIGKGQRGLIVAAPRTGKTVLMQNIANAILVNHPEVYVIVLLVDERPEEVTEMKRIIYPFNSEVISSTFDETAKNHTMVAEIVIEKAKRLVEMNQDVVIVLDSITRLARAYNNNSPSSGKIMSGGIDANAMHKPKRFFGSARKTEEAGSLTIIATALVDTGSRMDQVIFEEFKGTGNMELVLDRAISDMRLFPAIDLIRSGTRREELLLSKTELNRMFVLRKFLKTMNPVQGMETLRQKVSDSKSNADMLTSMSS
ncbi:MAG TPA: transcription termination factor Rho [Candidatus Cloacimonadota bacterium]|jgi:transcription termination factor Rho|nr:transcription termination factor Rho [Candidatus Cloacimonadota bacterium]HOD53088.1 transcription termination factor Rho [Candidatus Cloacimonadota bacterium]HPM01341.1 transcription termination factor Rho [Candidatus Cloacimonadota bacterium]